jgi:hypothetical protein
VLTQWLLVGSAGAVLFWLQPLFSGLLAAFLGVSHYLGTRGQGSRLILWSGIAAAIAILLGFKYGAPALVSLFANPGGLPPPGRSISCHHPNRIYRSTSIPRYQMKP